MQIRCCGGVTYNKFINSKVAGAGGAAALSLCLQISRIHDAFADLVVGM